MSLDRRLRRLERARRAPAGQADADADHPIFRALAADGLVTWVEGRGWAPLAPLAAIERGYLLYRGGAAAREPA